VFDRGCKIDAVMCALQVLFRLSLQATAARQLVSYLGELTEFLMHLEDEPVPIPPDLVQVCMGRRCERVSA
jgi:hypothetical protein